MPVYPPDEDAKVKKVGKSTEISYKKKGKRYPDGGLVGKKETDYDKCTAKKSSPFDLNQKRRLFSKQKEAEQRKGEIDEKESDCIAACSGHGNVSDSLWGYI